MKTEEVLYEKVYMSPRPPPKISLKHEWKRELGSEHAQRPEGRVLQQSRSFQSKKSLNVEQTHERTGRPVATLNTADAKDSSRVRSLNDSDTLNVDDEGTSKKNGKMPLLIMTRIMNQ